MKNSFFLVIPKQQDNPLRLQEFEVKILEQWIAELPTANLSMATRLIYDYIVDFNSIKMPVALRIDALEMLRPSYLAIEDFLRARMIKNEFPKDDKDQKILKLLVALERQFTLSYWIVLKERSSVDLGWFRGKTAALSIQRCIEGLSNIVISHFMMGMPVVDWVWLDLHSLYKLSVKIKKNTTQVAAKSLSHASRTSSPEASYLQVILLSLADPTGLMQEEIRLVYDFIETIIPLVSLQNKPVERRTQCVILVEEDQSPYFHLGKEPESDSVKLYLDLTKLYLAFAQKKIPAISTQTRFSRRHALKTTNGMLTADLLAYLQQRWSGIGLESEPLFSDRLDRFIAIGLTSSFKLLKSEGETEIEHDLEIPVQSVSNRLLSGVFSKSGVLSVGSLISFRKADMPEHRRALGVVDKLEVQNDKGKLHFGVQLLASQTLGVSYLMLDASPSDLPKKGLFYSVKDEKTKSYLIVDTFSIKEGDVIRLLINNDDVPIALKNKKNIGLGYWQFECWKWNG